MENPPEIVINKETTDEKITPKAERKLDYMMAKPKNIDLYNQSPILTKSEDLHRIESAEINIKKDFEYANNNLDTQNSVSNKSVIEQTEIKTTEKDTSVHIDIEKENILKAITYAQVLEQPKSLNYLKRFGIYRRNHKD